MANSHVGMTTLQNLISEERGIVMRPTKRASFVRGSNKSPAHRAEQRTLTLEALENRCLLAVTLLPSSNGALATSPSDQVTAQAQPLNLVVTTLTDKLDTTYDPANLSLRDAIAEANANSGTDTITFASTLNGGTIKLSLGELAITDSVTIEGPGAANLTINGSQQSRIFNISDGNSATNISVEIDGLMLTGGSADNGGAIYSEEDLTLKSATVTGNTATNYGGGIFAYGYGTTTIQNTTISGNSSAVDGGGILAYGVGAMTIQDSTIAGNSANETGGGIVASSYGATTIQDSTICGNSAKVNAGGIGIQTADGSTTLIQNSTITGNTTQGTGGGLCVAAPTTSTTSPPSVTVESTIIAGNTDASATAPDVLNPSLATFTNCLVGDNPGSGLNEAPVGTPDSNGNLIGGPTHGIVDPKLGSLADNGGPTQTCALLAGSPAIEMGSNPAGLAYDQRGSGYPRVLGAQADIGAFEADPSLAAPAVKSISPAGDLPAGGTTVTITGANLAGATAVLFGTTPAAIQSDTATTITVLAPAGTSGVVHVTVTTAGGTSATGNADQFAYAAAPAPTVTGLNPATGSQVGNDSVVITGTGFLGATAVDFGGNAATFTVDSATQITATSPAGAAGIVNVTVTTASGTSATGNADQFTYAAAPAPTVTGLDMTSGSREGGTSVVITGTGFLGATEVDFGGNSATFTVDSATQITATSPAGAVGVVDVTVTTATGTSVTSSMDQFTYSTASTGLSQSVGLYDPSSSTFLLRNTNDSGYADEVYSYGAAKSDMVPIVGDWTGTGVQSIGLYDQSTSTFYLRNMSGLQGPNDQGYADTVFTFGPAHSNDVPVVGDWNGDGKDSIGLYDPETSTFYLRNTDSLQGPNDHGYADIVFNYGAPHSHMLPVIGDWDGSGQDGIGLYSQSTSTFYLREATQLQGANDHGFADVVFNYGAPHQQFLPIAGDWNGGGKDGIGLYDQETSMFYLRNSIQLQGPSDHGFADLTFLYGSAHSDQLPLAGRWTVAEPITTGGTTTIESGVTLTNVTTITAESDCVRLTAPTTESEAPPMGGTGCVTLPGTGLVLSSGTLSVQSPSVNSQALAHIDPSTVAGDVVGTLSLDSVADDLSGTLVETNASLTDAALAS